MLRAPSSNSEAERPCRRAGAQTGDQREDTVDKGIGAEQQDQRGRGEPGQKNAIRANRTATTPRSANAHQFPTRIAAISRLRFLACRDRGLRQNRAAVERTRAGTLIAVPAKTKSGCAAKRVLQKRGASFETRPSALLRMTVNLHGIKKERHPEEPAQRASRRVHDADPTHLTCSAKALAFAGDAWRGSL